jgi:Flp pilus assembly protein TadD
VRAAALVTLTLLALSGCGHLVVLHDPLTAPEHNDLGVAYERAGKVELAAREYRKALRLEPGLTIARVNLGNLAAGRGRWRDAERCYRAALETRPDDADALNDLATALIRQRRRLDEAERLAGRAVAIGGRDSLYRATLEEARAARGAAPAGGAR